MGGVRTYDADLKSPFSGRSHIVDLSLSSLCLYCYYSGCLNVLAADPRPPAGSTSSTFFASKQEPTPPSAHGCAPWCPLVPPSFFPGAPELLNVYVMPCMLCDRCYIMPGGVLAKIHECMLYSSFCMYEKKNILFSGAAKLRLLKQMFLQSFTLLVDCFNLHWGVGLPRGMGCPGGANKNFEKRRKTFKKQSKAIKIH